MKRRDRFRQFRRGPFVNRPSREDAGSDAALLRMVLATLALE